ncbi:MAG: AAA family ATPase [Caldilineales bacterium]|nr:AAA family ATPase [Caldilineales bacterium]
MKKRLSPILLATALALTLLPFWGPGAPVRAQSYPDAWHTYDRFDGVDATWLNSAIQTEDGVLWFGADKGVLRFDGEWKTYGEAEGLSDGPVRRVVADGDGNLWATTLEGIALLVDDQWQLQGQDKNLPNAPFQALAVGPTGEIWAGGDAGLYMRDAETDRWALDEGFPLESVTELAFATDGALWAAGANGLVRDEGGWSAVDLSTEGEDAAPTISALEAGGDGDMWIGTREHGLAHRSGGRTDWLAGPGGLPILDILTILETANGELWIGTNGDGAFTLTDEGWRILTPSDGLAADYVSTIIEDADGILWLGTVAGVSRFDRSTWQAWGQADGATDRRVLTLVLGEDGALWAGSSGDGLFQFDGEDWAAVAIELENTLPVDRYIESSFIANDGALWLGTNGGGALRYADGEITHITVSDGLAGGTVTSISQTPDGALWFGTFRDGLSRWGEEGWETFTTEGGLISNHIQALFTDSKGQLWVGTDEGVSLWVDDAWRNYTIEDGLAANDVTAIAEGSDGSIWFATWGKGASRLKEGEWINYGVSDGLLAPGLNGIWADPDSKRVWFATVSGLSVFDEMTWQNYGVAQDYNLGRVHAIVGDGNGNVYLGVDDGVMRFTPHYTPPTVEIQAVNGIPADQKGMRLTPEQALLISFAGKDLLTDPANLFYRYRLQGYDEDWTDTRLPQASYPPLPEGEYHFEVQARDDGLNYSTMAGVDIDVLPAPSEVQLPLIGPVQTKYALIVVSVMTLLAVLGAYAIWSTATRFAMRRQAVERRFNPYVAGSPIREDAMFFGRDELLDDIVSGLYQNSIMIHGERRIGKTSLLYQVKERLEKSRSNDFRFVPIYVDLEGTPEPEFFHRLMEGVLEALTHIKGLDGLVDQLEYDQEQIGDGYSDRDFRRDLREIIERLQAEFKRQPRLVFLLDEADIMNTYDTLTQQQLRRILQDAFAQNVGALVAGVGISKVWDRVESPWYNMFVEMALEPFARADAESLMREPVARFYDWDEDAIHYVYAQSQGRPHRIQQVCREAVNIMLDEHRRRITLPDVQRAYERVIFAENN